MKEQLIQAYWEYMMVPNMNNLKKFKHAGHSYITYNPRNVSLVVRLAHTAGKKFAK